MSTRCSFLVAGGGIGGLAAALALLRAGADVLVAEQAPALGEVGAGLTLSRGAMRCCEALGVGDAVRAKLSTGTKFEWLHYQTGHSLPGTPPAPPADGDNGHIYRADLHGILADAVKSFGAERILLGHRFAGLTQTSAAATAEFANGARITAQCIIGADGARSAVRRAIFNDGPPLFTGKTAFRFMLPAEIASPFLQPGGRAALFVGPGRVFNRYLVSNGRLLNCAALQADAAWANEGWHHPATVDEMLAAFVGWHPSVLALIARAPADKLIKWGIFSRVPQNIWVQGRVALLGDAAHPMQPFLGLGAAMAIEDGVILGRAVAEKGDIDAALAAYAAARVPRANQVMLLSKLQGELFDTTDPADFPPKGAPSHDPSLASYHPGEVAL